MSTAAKVGGFFLVVLVLAGLLIWRIEDLRLGSGPAKKISVEFKDVAGLDAKSTVRLAGVRVGKVARIRLTPDGKAVVEMDLDKDVELRQGASAAVANLGLLGEKYVELVPGPVGAPELPEGTTIKGDVPVSFDQITRLARDIEVDVKDITKNLNSSLGGPQGEERLRTIVENIRVITEDLRVMVASNRGNVDATLANLRDFTEGMTQLVDRVDKLIASNPANVTAGHREHQGRHRQARDDRRQPEPDHRQDQVRGGDRRQARRERGDPQEPERRPGLGQGRRRRPEQGAGGGRPDPLRFRRPLRDPDELLEREGVLHPRHQSAGVAPLLPARARDAALRPPLRRDDDRADDVSRRPRRGEDDPTGGIQGPARPDGALRLPVEGLGPAGRAHRVPGRRGPRLQALEGPPPLFARRVGLQSPRATLPPTRRSAARTSFLLRSISRGAGTTS